MSVASWASRCQSTLHSLPLLSVRFPGEVPLHLSRCLARCPGRAQAISPVSPTLPHAQQSSGGGTPTSGLSFTMVATLQIGTCWRKCQSHLFRSWGPGTHTASHSWLPGGTLSQDSGWGVSISMNWGFSYLESCLS